MTHCHCNWIEIKALVAQCVVLAAVEDILAFPAHCFCHNAILALIKSNLARKSAGGWWVIVCGLCVRWMTQSPVSLSQHPSSRAKFNFPIAGERGTEVSGPYDVTPVPGAGPLQSKAVCVWYTCGSTHIPIKLFTLANTQLCWRKVNLWEYH